MPTLAWVALGVVAVVCIDQASKAMLLSRIEAWIGRFESAKASGCITS